MKKHIGSVVYAFILMVFTVYLALDTFVIPRVYAPEQEVSVQDKEQRVNYGGSSESGSSGAESSGTESSGIGSSGAGSSGTESSVTSSPVTESSGEGFSGADSFTSDSSIQNNGFGHLSRTIITNNSYRDDHIQIFIQEYREYNSTIYVADIILSSVDYLQTALAQNVFGRNVTEKTSEMAAENNAILAINGDFYGTREKGYVIRNGILYRDTASKNQEDLVIYQDGSFAIITEGNVSAQELQQKGAVQVLSFGPALVVDGEIAVSKNAEVGKAKSGNPRTAIAIVENQHYLFLVSDGRTSESPGLSLYELAEFSKGLGGEIVYNLDGGGSSAMYFNGEIINHPTTDGRSIRERSVSDIVFIGN